MDESPIHIAKYLARCGMGSRQACERIVDEGNVYVNGTPCVHGERVRPGIDTVEVDGVVIVPAAIEAYLVHKSAGVSASDAIASACVEKSAGLQPALSVATEADGAMLALSDGAMSAALQGPTCCVRRRFILSVRRFVEEATLRRLRDGIAIRDGASVVRVHARVIREGLESTLLRIEIDERHRRHLRHVFRVVGHDVLEQHSVALGPIELGDLPVGASRPLAPAEIAWLEEACRSVARHAS